MNILLQGFRATKKFTNDLKAVMTCRSLLISHFQWSWYFLDATGLQVSML